MLSARASSSGSNHHRYVSWLLIISFACLVGIVTGIKEEETSHLQPCPFNLLCRCSRGGPEVGLIYCEDIPLADVPATMNSTKAFALYLRRNGLRRLEENSFHRTGLWRIDIRNNYLSSIPEKTFAGLERSLGELNLPFNRLQRVPQKALRNLEKLKVLDLGNNQIVDVSREDFSGVEDTLQVLSLADNYIITLALETFQGFTKLERLDLKGNSILNILPLASGTLKLSHLNLAENSIERIPFTSLAQIRSLTAVNLANNRITSTFDVFFQGRISLDSLVLDNNMIGNLPPFAFQNFNVINSTSLNGNIIKEIDEDAFKDAKIRELSIRDCFLTSIDQKAFRGLETSLQRLDLSFNNLNTLPEHLLDKFDYLKTLILGDNPLSFKPSEVLSGFRYTLETISLAGEKMGAVPVKEMNSIRNLRSMSLCSLDEKVSSDDFEGFGAALETLSLSKNKLKTIASNAFLHIPGLKSLDLSENRISKIENDAFVDIASSLTHLYMPNSLSLSSLPSEPFKKLLSVRSIDLSNNRITTVPADFFHSMKELAVINLQDNSIDKIEKHLFDRTPHLVNLFFGFNYITTLETATFVDMPELKMLQLEDNKIKRIAKGAFQNIENLESINLEGNLISEIDAEAFHNLPKLEVLNLAWNKLTKLNFDWLDQVGTLSAIKLDVSHNLIPFLESNSSAWSSYSSIRALDLGFNNITFISRHYFEPIRSSLTHLVLRNNQLRNISRDIYSDMQHLLWLDLSENDIQLVDSEAFANAKNLQVLLLNNNDISEIYQDMLSRSSTLRIINVSHNRLRFLPDTLFKDTQLEILDVSYNQIAKMPDGCLSRISNTLRHLDVSHNEITFVNADQFKKLVNLVYLDLSHNDISSLPEKTFSSLGKLTHLDLSNNPIQTVADHIFDNLVSSLVELNLANIGLNLSESIGQFHLPELISLNISENTIDNLPSDFFTRYANLKEFDISHCDLTVLHESPWSTASKLRALHLNGNQLTHISNGTLAAMKSLEYLNIQQNPLQIVEEGCLYPMTSLRHLAISTYERVKGLDITKLIDYNLVIKHLDIEIDSTTFDNQLKGKIPFKISNITISGEKLKSISSSALKEVQSRSLTLTLRDNSVTDLSRSFFQNLGQVRWLQLDVRENKLASVAEPTTTIYPGTSGSVFLTHLHMSGNPWKCDCTTGWVEFWMRKWRQFMCKDKCSNYHSTIRDLRASSCQNKGNKSFMEALKIDLECGWSSSSTATSNWLQMIFIVAVGILFI